MNYSNPQDFLRIQVIFSGNDCFLSLPRIIIWMTSSLVAKLFDLHEYKETLMGVSEEERLSIIFIFLPIFSPLFPSFLYTKLNKVCHLPFMFQEERSCFFRRNLHAKFYPEMILEEKF